MPRYSFIILIFLSLCSCRKNSDAINKFGDELLVTIANLQDRRSGDSLLQFFENENSVYRRAAALAFASIQDSNYVKPLNELLISDPDITVRVAAAYALGQTPGLESELSLGQAASTEQSEIVLGEIIEGYGKVARSWKLKIAPRDTVISRALSRAYYRMSLRGLSDTIMNRSAAGLLTSAGHDTRFAAAHYFARGAKGFQAYTEQLIRAATAEESPLIRMAAAQALGKNILEASLNALKTVGARDADYRVRLNAIKSLRAFPFDDTRSTLLEALTDSNINVSISAAETIALSATKNHWKEVLNEARNAGNWRVKANLFDAALQASGLDEVATEIKTFYKASENPYEQATLLNALRHLPSNAEFLHRQLMEGKEPVIKSSAALALVGINRHEGFKKSLSATFAKYYEEAISDGDVAVIGIVCDALADSTLNYRSIIKDFSFLKRAKEKLSLPRDFESVLPLNMAINYFEGKTENPGLSNNFNHPIDWKLVKKIPANQRATIKTVKGDITIRLLVEEAPGSVANFVSLASSGYFNSKRIHRVATNFVVQDGCPRGDGWGSEDYSIRSEFMPHSYSTGSVGMASAGKDTECTQWFITHSPTPHLEGRYTLFAEVENGMDVVHNLEIGDSTLSVEIIDFTSL